MVLSEKKKGYFSGGDEQITLICHFKIAQWMPWLLVNYYDYLKNSPSCLCFVAGFLKEKPLISQWHYFPCV